MMQLRGEMVMFEKIKAMFSRFGGVSSQWSTESKVVALKRISSNLIDYLVKLSSFQDMVEDEIYEQLFIWEPEIGGAVDRIGTLVGQSYQGVYLKDVDEVEDDAEKRTLELAKKVADTIDVRSQMEALSRLLMVYGNIFIHWPTADRSSYTILPNRYMTAVPSKDLISSSTISLITSSEYYIFKEGTSDQQIYPKSSITHIKYDDTPIFVKDTYGRTTYGVYSLSPIHRTVIPVWWKRQTMITDIMWRVRNVPREHHKIKSEMFSLDKYEGTWAQRRAAAKADASAMINEYVNMLENQMPDQGYVSLDSIDITPVDSKTSGYMRTNELMEQLDAKIWTALNVPASIVNGTAAGSYASELAVSNYVTAKVVQMAHKVKGVMLECIRSRVRMVDPTLPIDKIDLKIELVMSTSRLEIVREASIMATLGIFTDAELRGHLGWEPLTEDQKTRLVQIGRAKTSNDVARDVNRMNGIQYPTTAHSDAQTKRDPSQITERQMFPEGTSEV